MNLLTGWCGGEETGENAQILGPPAGGLTARLHAKSETASKVVHSGCVSEVDAKSVFRFLHCVSVGVPKIFAVFSCFLYELSVLDGFYMP
ncbi:hypothetical protein ABH14_07285 [Brevibacillus brevis]|nr:hypothetical protein [Brevibacillus brevis]